MLWLALPASAAEVGAIVRPEAAVDLAADRDHEDAIEVRTWVRAFARDDLEREARWFLEILGQHELLVGRSTLTAGPNDDDVEGAWDLRVGESGWQGRLGDRADLRVGNLVERWGKLDLFPVVDVINPRDLRAGPLTPTEWQRVPVPMAALGVGREAVRGELVLIPFSTGDRMSLTGTDWSVVRQEMLEEQLAAMAGWGGTDLSEAQLQALLGTLADTMDELDPAFRRGLDVAAGQQELPQALGVHGEAAARLELAVPQVDAAVMVGLLRSRQRAVSLNQNMVEILRSQDLPGVAQPLQAGQVVDASWPRTAVVGAEASTLLGSVALRAEGLYQSAAVVQQPWMQSTTRPLVGAGVGADYSWGTRLYVVAEGSWRHLVDPPAELVFAAPDAIQVGGGARLNLAADRVEVQVGGAYHLPFAEHLVRPTVAWRVSDRVELEAGALILGGSRTPPETLRQALIWDGGMLGYFGQNDAATFAVSAIL